MSLIELLDNDAKLYKILSDLQGLGIEAYVAGGYCRDTYLGQPYRDIDIFVKIPTEEHVDSVTQKVMEYFDKTDLWLSSLGESDGYDNLSEVIEQYCFEYEDLPLNIIFRNFDTLESLLDTFNFGINMAGMTCGHWVFAPKFMYDVVRQVITVYKPDDTSNAARLEMLREKYPWPSVQPESLDALTMLDTSLSLLKNHADETLLSA